MNAITQTALRLAEDTEFDASKVTPGVEGFIFTGLLAAAIITLGFLLVRRLRNSGYRHEVREQIAQELAEREGTTPGGAASGSAATGSAATGSAASGSAAPAADNRD